MNEESHKDCCSKAVEVELKNVRHDIKNVKTILKEVIEDYEKRVRSLEDWKLVFVAKFTVYSTLALFLGSIISQLLFTYLKFKLS